TSTAVSVEELQRAWVAIQDGRFRHRGPNATLRASTTSGASTEWTPTGQVVAVVGAAGRVGSSTVALALATAADTPARVVECCSPTLSGFTSAASAELGLVSTDWR